MLTARLHTVQWLSPMGLKKLAYREWGEPDNPHVLLCVHGLTRSSQDFEQMGQTLGKRLRVVAADMPGRGGSDWLGNGALYAVPNYVAACVALVARLNPGTLDWFGTSMGGLIGMGYASLPGNPVRRLILNDVGPSLNFEALSRIGQYVGKSPVFANLDTARAAVKAISLPFGPHTDTEWNTLCDSVLIHTEGGWTTHYDPLIGASFQGLTPDTVAASEGMLWAAYSQIQAQTLVVRGEFSDLLSPATCQRMSTEGPKAQLKEIPGVGHAPTFMHADQIRIVEDFLF